MDMAVLVKICNEMFDFQIALMPLESMNPILSAVIGK